MNELVAKMLRGEAGLPPVAHLIGFEFVEGSEGRSLFRMTTDPARHGNPMGTVHGGVLCDLADAAMGVAFASTLAAGESCTTLERKIHFLRPTVVELIAQ